MLTLPLTQYPRQLSFWEAPLFFVRRRVVLKAQELLPAPA